MKIMQKQAFTLMEILVVVSIFSIIAVISSRFLITGFKSTKFNEEQEEAIEHGRDAIDEMTRTIRSANFSEAGDYVLSVINPQEIKFYADPDFDNIMEKVSYYLEGSVLKKSIIEPSGTPATYSGAPIISTITEYINNDTEAIFSYYKYDTGFVTTSVLGEVRMVKVYIKINVTPSRAPGDYILQSDVQLRNLKDN